MDYFKDVLPLEYGILGRVLMKPDEMGIIASMISHEDFEDATASKIWRAMLAMFKEGTPVDATGVNLKLGGGYDQILLSAKSETVRTCLENGPIEQRGRQLADLARMRRIRNAAAEIIESSTLDDMTPIAERLAGLCSERPDRVVMTADDAVQDFLCRHFDGEPANYMHLGFRLLDSKLYIERGDFILLGGYPSAGKTALALQMAVNMAAKYRTGFFSIETSPQKLMDRIMAQQSGISLEKVKRNEISEAELPQMKAAAKKLAALQLDLIPASGMNTNDIRAYSLKGRYDCIIVDYLQLITGRGASRFEQVTNISQDLHRFSQGDGITVIALSQLTRPEKTSEGLQQPNMHSFRESGQIEQDADGAMIIYQKDMSDYRSNRYLNLCKNKEGERALLELHFDGQRQRFSEINFITGE